jgi:hypothetical protein
MEAYDIERICKAFIRLISSEEIESRQCSISRQGRDSKSESQHNRLDQARENKHSMRYSSDN